MQVNSLLTRSESAIRDIEGILRRLEFNETSLAKTLGDKEELTKTVAKDLENKTTVSEILKATKILLEKITYANKGKLENFLTYGLQEIFPDRNYELKLTVKEDGKRPALEITLSENGVDQEITDSVGGGITTTLGLLLQIYYIEVYNLNKVMFMDESLVAVSKGSKEDSSTLNYLSNVLAFLTYLANERNYKFVIVTHDETVADIADKVYRVKGGVVTQL